MTHRSDRYRLAIATNRDVRAINRVLAGERTHESTAAEVRAAARRLGITIPERDQVSPQSSDPAPPPAPHVERAERSAQGGHTTHTSNTRPAASDAHGAPRKRNRAGAGSRARSEAKWAARVAARNGQVSA